MNIRASALLAAGCRYFVCFGEQSETVHDRIDDIIVEHGYDGVTTTFHCDESEQDVADFFMTIAFSAMNGALVLSCNQEKWMERLLSSGG